MLSLILRIFYNIRKIRKAGEMVQSSQIYKASNKTVGSAMHPTGVFNDDWNEENSPGYSDRILSYTF